MNNQTSIRFLGLAIKISAINYIYSLLKTICLLFFLIVSRSLNAQLINDGQIIEIEEGTQITILGCDMINNGDISNAGVISIDSDWSNEGTYQSSGAFELIGTDQTVDHGISVFNQLTILGGGTKTLDANLYIASQLDLNSGVLMASDNDISVNLLNDAKTTGGSDESYVSGLLFQMGAGDILYPVGTATEYLPVTLLGVQKNEPVGIVAISGDPSRSIDTELKNVSNDHFWELQSEGTISADGIILPLKDEHFINTTENAVVAYSFDSSPFSSLGATLITGNQLNGSIMAQSPIAAGFYAVGAQKQNQTITFDPIPDKKDNQGTFTLTATASSGLPITYTSSNESVATIQGNVVTLFRSALSVDRTTLITASQAGDDNFKAADPITQEMFVAWVLSMGDNFLDEVKIYPIPFETEFNIVLPQHGIEGYQLMIYDLNGRQVANRTLNPTRLTHQINDLSQMSRGIYTVQLIGRGKSATYRIIKK